MWAATKASASNQIHDSVPFGIQYTYAKTTRNHGCICLELANQSLSKGITYGTPVPAGPRNCDQSSAPAVPAKTARVLQSMNEDGST